MGRQKIVSKENLVMKKFEALMKEAEETLSRANGDAHALRGIGYALMALATAIKENKEGGKTSWSNSIYRAPQRGPTACNLQCVEPYEYLVPHQEARQPISTTRGPSPERR